jgi:hypothetical protein
MCPGDIISSIELSWIQTVFKMAADISNNKAEYQLKEQARLKRINDRISDSSVEYDPSENIPALYC